MKVIIILIIICLLILSGCNVNSDCVFSDCPEETGLGCKICIEGDEDCENDCIEVENENVLIV